MLKSKFVVALSLAVGSTAALAGEIYPLADTANLGRALTRAEVLADLAQARANDEIIYGERSVQFASAPSVKTREVVRAETREAIRMGRIVYGEAAVL